MDRFWKYLKWNKIKKKAEEEKMFDFEPRPEFNQSSKTTTTKITSNRNKQKKTNKQTHHRK